MGRIQIVVKKKSCNLPTLSGPLACDTGQIRPRVISDWDLPFFDKRQNQAFHRKQVGRAGSGVGRLLTFLVTVNRILEVEPLKTLFNRGKLIGSEVGIELLIKGTLAFPFRLRLLPNRFLMDIRRLQLFVSERFLIKYAQRT